MCKRPFYRNGNLNTCIHKVSIHAFIQEINSNSVFKGMPI